MDPADTNAETPEVTPEATPEVTPPQEGAPETPKGEAPPAEAAPWDWAAWDGSIEAVPEEFREVAGHVHSFFAPQLDEWKGKAEQAGKLEERASELQGIIDALSAGGPDPRIEKAEAALRDVQSKLDKLTGEHTAFRNAVEQQEDAQAVAYAQWFQQAYPQFWSDAALGKQLNAMIDKGWDAEAAAQALLLGPEAVRLMTAAKEKGAPDAFALEHAITVLRGQGHVPSPAAGLVAGSGKLPAKKGEDASRPTSTMNSNERRLTAATRAFAKHGLG